MTEQRQVDTHPAAEAHPDDPASGPGRAFREQPRRTSHGPLWEGWSSFLQVFAFARREISDIVRQPRLLLLLVVGPFAVLAVFGAGLQEFDPPLDAIFVAPDDEAAALVAPYLEDDATRGISSAEVTTDEGAAVAALEQGTVDIVVILPEQAAATVEAGEQASVVVLHDVLDPLEVRAVELFTQTAVADANAQLVATAVSDLQGEIGSLRDELPGDGAGAEAMDRFTAIPAEVLASPLDGEAVGLSETTSIVGFYAPAVTALLASHLVLVFAGMSLARERELGTVELYAVAPTSWFERLAGKLLGFLLIGLVISAVLIVGSTALFGIGFTTWPGWLAVGLLALIVVLLLLASAGLGLAIGALAKESGAVVQVSLLVLLAAIFLSGFLVSAERLLPWARGVGSILPATHGVRLLRDFLLRGQLSDPTGLYWLAGIAAVTLTLAALSTSRRAVA